MVVQDEELNLADELTSVKSGLISFASGFAEAKPVFGEADAALAKSAWSMVGGVSKGDRVGGKQG